MLAEACVANDTSRAKTCGRGRWSNITVITLFDLSMWIKWRFGLLDKVSQAGMIPDRPGLKSAASTSRSETLHCQCSMVAAFQDQEKQSYLPPGNMRYVTNNDVQVTLKIKPS